jgi:PEP-CTERM motif
MKKTRLLLCSVTAVAAVLSAGIASATVVTFDNLVGTNGTPIQSYSESGYSFFDVGAGNGCVARNFGNPVPSMTFGSTCNGEFSFLLTAANWNSGVGDSFRFISFDLAGSNTDLQYRLVGNLGTNNVWIQTGTLVAGTSFSTIAGLNPLAPVNAVQISVTRLGAFPNAGYIDNLNITASPVPEPATALLACVGFAGVLARKWRYA